jgi:hypothetical protein
MSTSLQTTLAAEAHLAEGQFLLEEQTLNIEKSLIYRTGTPKTNSFQNRRAKFRPTVIVILIEVITDFMTVFPEIF